VRERERERKREKEGLCNLWWSVVGFGHEHDDSQRRGLARKMDVQFGLFIMHSFLFIKVCVLQNQNRFN